jgi:hypothetical protein
MDAIRKAVNESNVNFFITELAFVRVTGYFNEPCLHTEFELTSQMLALFLIPVRCSEKV